MKDALKELITVGIARCCVLREEGKRVDEAEIIADCMMPVVQKLAAKITDLDEIADGYRRMFEENYESRNDTMVSTIKEMADTLKERINNLEYNTDIKRKTVRVEELYEQVNWVLHEVVPQTIDETVNKMCRECDYVSTADVVEVKHGEWILEKEPDGTPYCFHCSVCDDDFRRIDIKVKYPYCPCCGSKMDGERK